MSAYGPTHCFSPISWLWRHEKVGEWHMPTALHFKDKVQSVTFHMEHLPMMFHSKSQAVLSPWCNSPAILNYWDRDKLQYLLAFEPILDSFCQAGTFIFNFRKEVKGRQSTLKPRHPRMYDLDCDGCDLTSGCLVPGRSTILEVQVLLSSRLKIMIHR